MACDVGPRVLAVDDDVRSLALVERVLAGAGLPCWTARSADEALAQMRGTDTIDVIVSDIRMPGTDGIAFLERLRQEFGERDWLQIILVTGHASVDTAVAAMRLAACDYLRKPIDVTALRETVQHALRRSASMRQVGAARPGGDDAQALERFASVADELAVRIRRLGGAASEPRRGSDLDSLELLRRLQEVRQTVFGDAVMPEPAWEMLAELMRARLSDERLSVTSLTLSSRSPATTALRRIDDLVDCGLATRVPDPADRRRTYVELTAEGVQRMQLFLEGFVRTVDRANPS